MKAYIIASISLQTLAVVVGKDAVTRIIALGLAAWGSYGFIHTYL